MTSKVLAHVLEGGQEGATAPNYVLLALGCGALLLALWAVGRSRALVRGAAVAAVGLLVAGFLFDGGGGGQSRPDATVRFSTPRDGATVAAGEPIEVVTLLDGGTLAASDGDPSGGHLHISVDGQLRQMPYSTRTRLVLDPGRHVLTVEYVDHDHVSYDPPIETSIEVTAQRSPS